MKKILLISSKDCNFYNFRSELILKLKDMGYEIILSCPYGKKIDFFTQKGCRFINISMDRRGTNPFNDLKLMWDYYKILCKEHPDIVLAYTSKSSIYGGLVCGLINIPCIINNAGLTEANGILKKIINALYIIGFRKASCMMYQNSYERNYINKLLLKKVHYRDIPGSGVNINEFEYKPYPSDNNGIIFNYVGRIVKLKGIDEFLECATHIKKKYPNTSFRIYGEYDDISYKNKINKFEKKGIVKYCGSQLNMKPYIETAHAVIHPSHYEGMTNVILEHSAMGRVCIGSNIPGIQEAITDGKTGFLFTVKNVSSMVKAVEKFINLSYEQKKEMGYNARIKMENNFDRDIVTNIYIEEIKKIFKDKNKKENLCMNRNKIWHKAKPLLNILYLINKFSPKRFAQYNLGKFRFKSGWIAMANRYILLKRLGAQISGRGYCIIQPNVCIMHPEKLKIGNNVTINENSSLECSGGIQIGDNVMIGHGVSIISNTHNYQRTDIPMNQQGETFKKITIGNNVWIGAKATIILGVKIGNNAIIGANSFVNKDVNENEIVAGVPAKVIRTRGKFIKTKGEYST